MLSLKSKYCTKNHLKSFLNNMRRLFCCLRFFFNCDIFGAKLNNARRSLHTNWKYNVNWRFWGQLFRALFACLLFRLEVFVLWLSRNYEIRTFHLRNGDYFVIIAFSSHSMLLRNYTKNGLLGVFTLSLISSCCLADYVKECYQSACARAARLFFTFTNQIIVFWHRLCRCRCRLLPFVFITNCVASPQRPRAETRPWMQIQF